MNENEMVAGRVTDLWNRTLRGEFVNHTNFLSPDQQAAAAEVLQREHIPREASDGAYHLWTGGHEEADRQVLVFCPGYLDRETIISQIMAGEEVLTCVRISPVQMKFADPLTHRDYLGSLMHLGITREQIGDIMPDEGGAWVFVIREIAPFLCRELTRIRHTTVQCRIVPPSDCTAVIRTKECSGSISSVRLDSIVALAFNLPRSKAQQLIEHEKVQVDGRIVRSASARPAEGERISVRGHGKFKFLGTGGQTRRGRLVARYALYL